METRPTLPNGPDEAYRLSVLASLELLDTPPEPEFDALVAIARDATGCPTALVSLVDADRQWFKARCGMSEAETPREHAFCNHALDVEDILIVPDASIDPRFAGNPFVTGPAHIRFYAGVPIRISPEGGMPAAVLGTLCIIDTAPRSLSDAEAGMLKSLAEIAQSLIRARMLLASTVRYADERRAAAAEIQRQHDQLRRAERIADMGSWRVDLADEHIEWSDQVFAIHGLPVGKAPTLQRALDYYPVRARATISDALSRAIETGEPFDVEVDFTPFVGDAKRVRAIGEVERNAGGAPVAIIGVFQDITQRHLLELALRRSASQDVLTGLPNRAGYTAAIEREVALAEHDAVPLALLLIDLDGFKGINDTYGHGAGDAVLQTIAHRLHAPYLERCLPARLGGDEFVVIVPHADDCAILPHLVDRLLKTLQRPIDIRQGSVTLSGTIGVAWHRAGIGASDLLHCADLALYEAKRAGKNRAAFHQRCEVEPDARAVLPLR
jgi:diguanylate cyclase (GGDEF)-like protein